MTNGYDVIVVGGGHNGLTARLLPGEGRPEGPGAGGARRRRRRLRNEGGGRARLPAQLPFELPRDHPHGTGLPRPRARSATAPTTCGPTTSSRTSSPTAARWCSTETWKGPRRTSPGSRNATQRRSATLALTYRQVLEDGMIPAMFSPPGPPSGDLTPLEGSVEGLGLIRQFLSTPNHVARNLFESPEVQTWLGFWVAQLAGTGDVFGLGANYPIMLAGSLEPYGWAICKGGSNQLAQAMVRFLEEHGGEVRAERGGARTSTRPAASRAPSSWTTATRIPVDGVLLSNLDPRHTFLELVGESDLPSEFVPAVQAVALRRHVDVLRLPGAGHAGPLEGGRGRSGGRALLRGVHVRDPRRPGRQRERLPPGRPAATAGTVHGAPLAVRGEPGPRGQGGLLRRADRSLRAAGRRPRGLGEGEARVRRDGPGPLAALPRLRPGA